MTYSWSASVLCALSGAVTGWIVILIFLDALLGINFSREIALMFIAATALFTTALLFFLIEINASVTNFAARLK